jgi:two-component system heavy metal sensor histidine kinase CusS
MRSRFSSLSSWLTVWYTVACFAILGLAIGSLYWALVSELDGDTDLFLTDKVNVIRSILHDRPDDWSGLREEVDLEPAARRYERFYIRLLDQSGETLLSTPGMDRLLPASVFPPEQTGDRIRGVGVVSTTGDRFRAITTAVPVGVNTEKQWRVQVAVDRAQDEKLLSRYRHWLWSILAAALLFCPFVGYRIARRGIRPVERIAETAQRISCSTLHERIQAAGYPVELAALANTFNAMLDRLEDSFSRLSDFSADIAHELRTPVNNIRGEAEVALARARSVEEYREVLGSCLEEAVRLSELIGNLLFLARAESPGEHLTREPIEVDQVFQAVHDYFEPAATESSVQLITQRAEGLIIVADRMLLQRALANLVSNALAHTPSGGKITLRAYRQPGAICMEVQDTGIGIPPDALPRVLDRFYRVDRARSSRSGGTGLGLAIVKGIVTMHGGTIDIRSEVGVGTTVSLLLPIQPGSSNERSIRPCATSGELHTTLKAIQ